MKNSAKYREILKDVIGNQIQILVDQLLDQVGVDSVLLMSDSDGFSIGSSKGKLFLEERGELETEFCGFCSQGVFEKFLGTRELPEKENQASCNSLRAPNQRLSGYQLNAKEEQSSVSPQVGLDSESVVEEFLKDTRRCQVCDYVTKYSHNLKRHVQSKHGIGGGGTHEKMMKCLRCGYMSRFKSNMQRHQRKVHGVSISNDTVEELAMEMPVESEHIQLNSTHDITFEDKQKLDISAEHINEESNSSKHAISGTSLQWQIKKEVTSDDNDETQDANATVHVEMYSHPKSKKRKKAGLECNYCRELFSDLDTLKEHVVEMHFGGRSDGLICNICGKEFRNEVDYQGHIAGHDNLLKCTCGNVFNSHWSWRKHKACCKISKAGIQIIKTEEDSEEGKSDVNRDQF